MARNLHVALNLKAGTRQRTTRAGLTFLAKPGTEVLRINLLEMTSATHFLPMKPALLRPVRDCAVDAADSPSSGGLTTAPSYPYTGPKPCPRPPPKPRPRPGPSRPPRPNHPKRGESLLNISGGSACIPRWDDPAVPDVLESSPPPPSLRRPPRHPHYRPDVRLTDQPTRMKRTAEEVACVALFKSVADYESYVGAGGETCAKGDNNCF